jgi:hypothetical protein
MKSSVNAENQFMGVAWCHKMIVYTKPHPLSYFFASTGYGAYQKALASAFQQRRPCLAFLTSKLSK